MYVEQGISIPKAERGCSVSRSFAISPAYNGKKNLNEFAYKCAFMPDDNLLQSNGYVCNLTWQSPDKFAKNDDDGFIEKA